VTKSITAILGLGTAACVMLSLMMKHLVTVESDRSRSPLAAPLATRLGTRLVGPLRIRDEQVGERRRLVVAAQVTPGLDKRRLAQEIGREAWFLILRAGEPPDEIVVELGDERSADMEAFPAPAPPIPIPR
jgi:hypothetical protein